YRLALIFFLCNETPPTEIYTLSLHDALPIMKQNYANYANKNLRKRRTIKMSNEQHNTIDTVNETGQLNKLGFWVFLTAEIALLGTLFATFLVLQKSGSYGGASTPELFELPLVMIMTFLLLVSSYTCGI